MHIECIPPELLAAIFTAALPAEDCPVSPTLGPLLLAQVSRQWRYVVLSDSSLWSSLRVSVTPNTTSRHPSVLELWLSRSSSQPLSITVWMDPFAHFTSEMRTILRDVFRLLSRVSDRWRRLTMILPRSNQFFTDLCASSPAPILESLSFKLGNWTAEEAWNINSLLMRAPALRRLSWSNRSSWASFDAPYDSGMEYISVAWYNLTSVVLDTWITLKTALYILRQCSNITHLDLRHYSYSPEFFDQEEAAELELSKCASTLDPSNIIRLPYLRSLSIYQLKLDDGLATLLDRLFCPALENFNYTSGFIERTRWPQPSFHGFLTRSLCRLQSLVLEFTGINELQLLQCLDDTTLSLERLEVYDARGDICVRDEILELLNVQQDQAFSVLCPNLHTLILHRVVCCTESLLFSALDSRVLKTSYPNFKSSAPLRHADILFSNVLNKVNGFDMHYSRYSYPFRRR